MEPQIRYVKTADGVSIAYFMLGEGALPLVLMDVIYSHLLAEWDEPEQRQLYEATARIATLVRYDHRGFGLSDRDVADLSLDGLVLDLEAVVERTLPDRPFALVAQRGVTTPIAITYAVRHPERLSHLVLTTPVARLPKPFAERMDALLEAPGVDDRFFSESLARMVHGWDDHDASRVLAARMRESVSIEGFRAFLTEMKRWDVRDLLPAIRTPTLLTSYKGHPLFGEEYAREIAAVVHGARVAIIDGATSAERGATQNAAIAEFLTDGRLRAPVLAAPAERTGGLRTILFTDIVGHTEMMQRLGDAKGRDVLREHERITRETLKQHGGAEVKTMGDGFMASFGSVTSAMECAIALQRAFHGQNQEPGTENLNVRVGLNAGEPIEEDGDLFGATVILASRIAAKAGAGEILVPDTVRGLLSGKGFVFGDRGEFVPKGFDEGVRLWDVRWRE
jgi:class 3 adenylate cyclase